MKKNLCWSILSITFVTACGIAPPSSPELDENQSALAKAAKVKNSQLSKVANTYTTTRGQFVLNGTTLTNEQMQVLSCIADITEDGVLNLSDIALASRQFGRSCDEILADSETPHKCLNFVRDPESIVDLSDMGFLSHLFSNFNIVDPSLCNDASWGDLDNLSPNQEGRLNLSPIMDDTDGDGVLDGEPPPIDVVLCGNGLIDAGEDCDGADLNNESCVSVGFESGTLSCSTSCLFEIEQCHSVSTGIVIDGPASLSTQHDQWVTLSGSGFGTKTQASPVVWDNVESGNFNPSWESRHNLAVGTESRHSNSQHCGTVNFQGNLQSGSQPADGAGHGRNGFFTGPNSVTGESWYAQYWFKLDNNWNWGTTGYPDLSDSNLTNIKIFRLWNPGNINENFVMATEGWAGGSIIYGTENVKPEVRGYFDNMNSWSIGSWHLLQFEYKESDLDIANGTIRVWRDGQLVLENTQLKTREDYAQFKRPFILGFYNSWPDSGTDRDDFYIDDAYIDNTWSRIEIGNSPNYHSCTHREIQIPSDWNDKSITFKVNQGSFESGTAYVFVIDANGNRSVGYPVTLE